MTERPILFNAEMVRAILAGTKTMTRRVVKPQPEVHDANVPGITSGCLSWVWAKVGGLIQNAAGTRYQSKMLPHCPYGKPGDMLWVRETAKLRADGGQWCDLVYAADDSIREFGVQDHRPFKPASWTPSIHMPRWASRITLEITGVRVERLQEISEEDAQSEGMVKGAAGYGASQEQADSQSDCLGSGRFAFANLINRMHGGPKWNFAYNGDPKYKTPLWDQNPWVWVIEFKRV